MARKKNNEHFQYICRPLDKYNLDNCFKAIRNLELNLIYQNIKYSALKGIVLLVKIYWKYLKFCFSKKSLSFILPYNVKTNLLNIEASGKTLTRG